MSKPNSTQQLTRSVRCLQKVSDSLLNPLPNALAYRLVEQGDDVLSGLLSKESLSQFHPFGEAHLPIPEQSPENAVDSEDRSAEPNHWLLNQNFTQLVADVEVVLKDSSKTEKLESKPQNGQRTNANSSDGKATAKKSQATDKSGSRLGESMMGAALSSNPDSRSKTNDAKNPLFDGKAGVLSQGAETTKPTVKETTIVAPLFKQLSSLVENWHFGDAVEFMDSGSISEVKNAVEPDKSLSNSDPIDRLKMLTTSIERGSNKGPQNSPEPVLKQASMAKRTPSQTSSMARAMPDLVQRSHNVESTEKVVSTNSFQLKPVATNNPQSSNISALNGLSSMTTQKVADALNEYLQEQAELHGVDLS